MVGWFIEEQDFRLPHQGARQCHAPAPATRQFRHELVRGQLQLTDYRVHLLTQIPTSPRLELRLHPIQFFHIGVIKIGDQMMVLSQQLTKLRQCAGHHVIHRLLGGCW